MAIPEDRLSTEVVDAEFILPETEEMLGSFTDLEGGPIGLIDTSGGMNNQAWRLQYVDPDFILIPQTTGSQSVGLVEAGVQQVTFCFDQNARPTFAYIKNGSGFLYWYNSLVSMFVTDEFPGLTAVMLSLDDKREMEVGANDIIFWYTIEVSPGVHNLYQRKQRQRFIDEYEMAQNCFPYFHGVGMHKGLRGRIALSTVP